MNIVRSVISLNQRLHSKSSQVTLKHIVTRQYAFKSDLKIKWVHPGKVPCTKPEKSGDLKPMPVIDKSQLQFEFRKSKELETADDIVRRLFTLQFAPRKKTTEVYVNETLDLVKRHPLDKGSAEGKIARWTGAIRANQNLLELHHPRNIRLKCRLIELIDKRKKQLKYLRRWDYKRFEWVIDTLNIVYKPTPTQPGGMTRRGSLRKLTQKYCDDLKTDRLNAYRLKLEVEQPAFLEEKIRTLEFIQQEQKDCGVEVTVTQEDIDAVKKQLQELLAKQAEEKKGTEEA